MHFIYITTLYTTYSLHSIDHSNNNYVTEFEKKTHITQHKAISCL